MWSLHREYASKICVKYRLWSKDEGDDIQTWNSQTDRWQEELMQSKKCSWPIVLSEFTFHACHEGGSVILMIISKSFASFLWRQIYIGEIVFLRLSVQKSETVCWQHLMFAERSYRNATGRMSRCHDACWFSAQRGKMTLARNIDWSFYPSVMIFFPRH